MEIRIQHIFLMVFIFLPSTQCLAKDKQPEQKTHQEKTFSRYEESQHKDNNSSELVVPKIKRREISIAEIDAEDFEIGIFYGLMNVEDFGSNPVKSVLLSYHLTEDIFVSAGYGRSNTEQTSFEVISGARLLTDSERRLQYYDFNIGVNLLPGEGFIGKNLSFNSAFYGVIGVGSTKFGGDQRSTYSGGVGYRIIVKDWLALNLEVKDRVFDIDILGQNKTTHNLSYQLGVSFFF